MPKMNFWSKDVPLIPYDLAKAKELVTQSGYNGEEIDILIASGNWSASKSPRFCSKLGRSRNQL